MSVSTLTDDYRKPDTTLRCETLYVDGDIDCNAIHARSIIPDPTNDLVCNKLTSNSIENTNDITTKNILYETTIINQVGSKADPFSLNPSVRNTIIRITDIDIAVGVTEYYSFNLLGVFDLTNYYFSANVLNSINTLSGTLQNTIPINVYITTSIGDAGGKTLGLKNTSAIAMTGGTIDVLINWIYPNAI